MRNRSWETGEEKQKYEKQDHKKQEEKIWEQEK